MGSRIGAITFQGLASGFPTQEIIAKLLELERRPIALLEERRDGFKEKLGLLQDLNSKSTALRDALRGLDGMNLLGGAASLDDEFRAFAAKSSNDDVATATATTTAVRGSLRVQVNQLATQERELSNGFASASTALGTGALSLTVGATGAQTTTNLTIAAADATPEGVVAAINGAGLGVTAFLVNDGSSIAPIHLAVVSDETGAANQFSIDASGLGGGAALTFAQGQQALDAQVTLDPGTAAALLVTSTSNTFTELVNGVSLQVKDDTGDPIVQISIESDVAKTQERLAKVVDAWNAVLELIEKQAVIDPATNRGGPLLGDSTLVSLKQRMTRVVASAIGSGSIVSSAQIGISLDRRGKLELDAEKLKDALTSDFAAVQAFFSGPGSFADQLRSVLDGFVRPVDGALVARTNGMNRSVQDLDKNIERALARLDGVEENLVRQFSALETAISRLQQQGNFLNSFLASQSAR